MTSPDFNQIRQLFPRAARKPWLGAGETHPFSQPALDQVQRYLDYRAHGLIGENLTFSPDMQHETKTRFAQLINANADEIAFVQSTTDAENTILAGLDLKGGNVVIDDLHFIASKYLYTMLAERGDIELRIVPHQNWQVDASAYADYIDDNTRLVSIALVSHINGHLIDAKAISELAHAKGAYLYADIIQGAGNTPIDVKALGIDFAGTATYKFLMGDFGIGFLYVDKKHHDKVVKRTRYGMRQIASSHDMSFEVNPDASIYEGTSSMPFMPGIVVHTGLGMLLDVGVENIVAHVKPLKARLNEALPALGYIPMTQTEWPTSIISFEDGDTAATDAKLQAAFGEQVTSFRAWWRTNESGEREHVKGIRLGLSIYNNIGDVELFIAALS